MSRVAPIHASDVVEQLVTSGQNEVIIKGVGWRILITRCLRKGQRSGGINVRSEVFRIKKIDTSWNEIEEIEYHTVKYTNRLKKGWKSTQLRRMIDAAYEGLHLQLKNNRLCVLKENKDVVYALEFNRNSIFYIHYAFKNGRMRVRDIATNKMYDLQKKDCEVLTVTPEAWYNKHGMRASLKRYQRFQAALNKIDKGNRND